MTCILIEDEQYWKCKTLILLDELGITVLGVAETVAEADALLKKHNPEFIIADIVLGEEFVFDLFKKNNGYCTKPTIFLTVSDKEVHYKQTQIVTNYLYVVKPIHKLTLKSAVENIVGKISPTEVKKNTSLIFKGRYNEDIAIPFSKIIYLSQNLKYCTIHTQQNNVVLKKTMGEMVNNLDATFLRIHNSYCINTEHILSVGVGLQNIKLKGCNEVLPIGASFIPAIKAYLSKENSEKY